MSYRECLSSNHWTLWRRWTAILESIIRDNTIGHFFRVCSCLAFWSPLFGETDWLPLFIFPFVKLFQSNMMHAFEVVATVLSECLIYLTFPCFLYHWLRKWYLVCTFWRHTVHLFWKSQEFHLNSLFYLYKHRRQRRTKLFPIHQCFHQSYPPIGNQS